MPTGSAPCLAGNRPGRGKNDSLTIPRTLLRPAILVLLNEQDDHGYALIERLTGVGLTGVDPGGTYRVLRALEDEGFVRSWWANADLGPPRRMYSLTGQGQEELRKSLVALAHHRDTVARVIGRGGGSVARCGRESDHGPRLNL